MSYESLGLDPIKQFILHGVGYNAFKEANERLGSEDKTSFQRFVDKSSTLQDSFLGTYKQDKDKMQPSKAEILLNIPYIRKVKPSSSSKLVRMLEDEEVEKMQLSGFDYKQPLGNSKITKYAQVDPNVYENPEELNFGIYAPLFYQTYGHKVRKLMEQMNDAFFKGEADIPPTSIIPQNLSNNTQRSLELIEFKHKNIYMSVKYNPENELGSKSFILLAKMNDADVDEINTSAMKYRQNYRKRYQ